MMAKFRVLVYHNQPLPISETFVYNQCLRLKRFEVFFLGSKRPQGARIELPEERLYLVSQGGPVGRVREAALKLGGYLFPDVVTWVRTVDPALIHAHFGPDGAVIMATAKRLQLPLVVSFQGTDATTKDEYIKYSYLRHRIYLRRRAKLIQSVDRVIVQSDFLWQKVTAQGFPESKIRLVRHGIDLDQFTPGRQTAAWGHVLFVGRLIERKGLHLLIEALRIVRQRFPDIRLTVIGDGPKREEYEAQAARHLGDGVEFLGAQPHKVVKEYLERAYLFCMPSVTMPSGEAESLGLVFLEAHAMSVPVVSFRSGGIPEVVVHGKTGLLAEEGHVEGLAHHLLTLLENSELRDQMGRAGRQRVERHFDLEAQNAKLEAVYDEVLAGCRQPQG